MIVRPRPQSSVGLAVTLAVGKHGPRERQRAYLRRILPWATVQSAGGRSPRRDQRHALWGELVGPGCCRGRAHCHGLRLWNFASPRTVRARPTKLGDPFSRSAARQELSFG